MDLSRLPRCKHTRNSGLDNARLSNVLNVEANEYGKMELDMIWAERFNVTYVETVAIASLSLT